jgi:hypothetical protein
MGLTVIQSNMPNQCCITDCKRPSYCGVKKICCGSHLLEHAFSFSSRSADAVLRVSQRQVKIACEFTTIKEYKSAHVEAIVDVDSIYLNCVVGKFLVTRDNADSKWRSVRISDHPTGILQNNFE